MGVKEKMMESMMGKMTTDEKKEMMDKMMEGFFSTMTKEDKQEMMQTMMPKMMEQMMGGENKSSDGENAMMQTMMPKMMQQMMGGENSMMNMMGSMMDSKEGSKFNPMDMCKNMMSTISKSNEIATFATPEVRQLFEEWVQEVEGEVLNYVNEIGSADPERIATHLKISKDSVIYFLSRLAQKGKLSIKVEKN